MDGGNLVDDFGPDSAGLVIWRGSERCDGHNHEFGHGITIQEPRSTF
jgi:hypothetical protein